MSEMVLHLCLLQAFIAADGCFHGLMALNLVKCSPID